MKRPFTIYFIVIALTLFALPILIFYLTSYFGLYFFPRQKEAWLNFFPSVSFKIGLFIYVLAILPLIYGLYQGRLWARNLAFFLLGIWFLYFGGGLLQIFTFNTPGAISGLTEFLLILRLVLLGLGSLMFYLLLRPEVGRFCNAYPETENSS